MTTQAVARIIDLARIHTPGALEGTLRLEFFNVLKDFLARTDGWQEDICIPVTTGYDRYAIPSAQQAIVDRLLWLEGPRPATESALHLGSSRKGILETTATSENPAVLRIFYTPTACETWYAHVALTVTDPTDKEGLPTLPEWLVEKYHDYLMSGLIARMTLHPGKPYSSDKTAMFHARRYQSGIALARKDVQQGHVYGGQRWSFPSNFASRSQRF